MKSISLIAVCLVALAASPSPATGDNVAVSNVRADPPCRDTSSPNAPATVFNHPTNPSLPTTCHVDFSGREEGLVADPDQPPVPAVANSLALLGLTLAALASVRRRTR